MASGAFNSIGVNEAQYNGTPIEYTLANSIVGVAVSLTDAKTVAVAAACAVGVGVTNTAAKILATASAVLTGGGEANTGVKSLSASVAGVSGVISAVTAVKTRSVSAVEIAGLALISFGTAHILRSTIARVNSFASLASSGSAAGLSRTTSYADLSQSREL